jgi:hypothetical protein
MPTAKTGTGTTVTLNSGFTAKYIDTIEPFAKEVGDIEANTFDSEDFVETIPEDLVQLGEFSGTIEYDPGADEPEVAVPDIMTIDPKGLGAGHLIRGSGYFKRFAPSIVNNGKMTAQITWKWDGGSFATKQS